LKFWPELNLSGIGDVSQQRGVTIPGFTEIKGGVLGIRLLYGITGQLECLLEPVRGINLSLLGRKKKYFYDTKILSFKNTDEKFYF